MGQKVRIWSKFLLFLGGCFFFLFLLGKSMIHIAEPLLEKQHVYITLQEAGNLVWLLAEVSATDSENDSAERKHVQEAVYALEGEYDDPLTYAQFLQLSGCLEEGLETLSGYRQKEHVKTQDFMNWFDKIKEKRGLSDVIAEEEIVLLGSKNQIHPADGQNHDNTIMTEKGLFCYHTPLFEQEAFLLKKLKVISCNGALYAIREVVEEQKETLKNAWILHRNEREAVFFWKNCEVTVTGDFLGTEKDNSCKETVADILIENGKIRIKNQKKEKVSGKILSVTAEGIELEGNGFFSFSEEPAFYRLYESLKNLELKDLKIGYAFSDFVLEKGKIAAALTVKEEKMEYIRVLLQASDYSGQKHQELELYADCDCIMYQENGTSHLIKAKDTVKLSAKDSIFDTNKRIRFVPQVLTGLIYLPKVGRYGNNSGYRGCLEIQKKEDGLVVINELLLEEYLYAVLPSEMPSSYPIEALKSQAVCARTYAYQKMCSAGLPDFGAHVDDSTAFQVYHAQPEQTESTKAVKETQGITMFWGNQPAEVFYYSTSCGVGTGPDIWREGNAEKYPYLKSLSIHNGKTQTDFEENEPWYRWKYEVRNINYDQLLKRMKTRYAVDPGHVLTKQKDESFQSEQIKEPGAIRNIKITERGDGNIAVSLMIEGEKEIFLVSGEYNIRYLLCDPDCEVIRNDGSSVKMATILPSAFFDMQIKEENGTVKGYLLEGGGYGHGVGMSQNAARQMALAGMNHREILDFFFEGCEQADIYGFY